MAAQSSAHMMCGMHASFPITCSFDVLIKCAAQAINSDCPFEEESCKATCMAAPGYKLQYYTLCYY